MTIEPTVSAVIPTFNTRDCVQAAIDSALNQREVAVEVIVVDDASKDGTADFVEQTYAGDKRVRVIRREQNGGPSAARNIGFRAASGTWIGLLDADDVWQPGRLAKLLAHSHEADFIADNIMGYDVVARAFTGPIYKGSAIARSISSISSCRVPPTATTSAICSRCFAAASWSSMALPIVRTCGSART